MEQVAREKLKAPFPWFGGKSRVAHLVWERFGDVGNYVEPFAGSLAVLLGRPTAAKVETVNDLDCYLANFWRALANAPEDVAVFADWPVNEADLHARHRWLHKQTEFRERMRNDPLFFDARIAGWWVWGLSCWIGDNWCRPSEQNPMPHLESNKGINAAEFVGGGRAAAVAADDECGAGNYGGFFSKVSEQVPFLSEPGAGVHQNSFHGDGTGLDWRRPVLGVAGNGVHAAGMLEQKRPAIGGRGKNRASSGVGVNATGNERLVERFRELGARLRRVRVCCGDWARVVKDSVTVGHGVTGVLLDPPYGVEDRDKVYNYDSKNVAGEVLAWCLAHGADKRLRIALCGYDGEHNALERRGWDVVAWKAKGGYGNQAAEKNENGARERIWFSPGCLTVGLF